MGELGRDTPPSPRNPASPCRRGQRLARGHGLPARQRRHLPRRGARAISSRASATNRRPAWRGSLDQRLRRSSSATSQSAAGRAHAEALIIDAARYPRVRQRERDADQGRDRSERSGSSPVRDQGKLARIHPDEQDQVGAHEQRMARGQRASAVDGAPPARPGPGVASTGAGLGERAQPLGVVGTASSPVIRIGRTESVSTVASASSAFASGAGSEAVTGVATGSGLAHRPRSRRMVGPRGASRPEFAAWAIGDWPGGRPTTRLALTTGPAARRPDPSPVTISGARSRWA